MATGGKSDLERGNDEFIDFLCSVCKRKNKITEALKFCTDCQDYLCSVCVNSHNDFLRNHQILDKAKFQPGSSVQFPMVPTERCTVHGHKPVDMYCRQHDVVGCATCMVIQHNSCEEKFYVPDYIKTTKVDNPKNIVKQLDTMGSSLKKLHKTFLQEQKNIKRSKEKSMQEIRKFRLEINQRLDELEKTSVQDLEGICQSLTDKIEATLKELQGAITEVQSAQNNLNSADSNMSQMFVSIKMANTVASQANEKVTAAQHQVSSKDTSFVPSLKLQSLFNDLHTLGSFSISEKLESQSKSPSPLLPVATTKSKTTSPKSQSRSAILQIKGSKKYKVNEKSDESTCMIWSACALDDGTIILSDFINSKLKCLDSSTYKVKDSCKVPGCPYQVCAISSQEVAVCCPRDKLIQFVSVGHTMQMTRQISTGFKCVGLAYADEELFVSDRFTSVYVYSMTGERLQQFSVPQSVDDGYIHLWRLAVSSDGSTIYVAHRRKGLIKLDKNGQLVGEFTDPKLNEACGFCLYNNSVLVCGEKFNNVLQFTLNGQLIGEVLKTDKDCAAICFCKKNSKLIVHLNDEIEVFNINE